MNKNEYTNEIKELANGIFEDFSNYKLDLDDKFMPTLKKRIEKLNESGYNYNFDEVLDLFENQSVQGDEKIKYVLANYYYINDKQKDIEKSKRLYMESSNAGLDIASLDLGTIAEDNEDYLEALKWYEKAAEQGSEIAQYEIVNFYYNKKGAKEELEKAEQWILKDDEQRSDKMIVMFGKIAFDSKNYSDAFKWFKKAADNGLAEAKNILGFLYSQGIGIETDKDEALKLFKESAEKGEPTAQLNLGNCYYNGEGTEKDLEKAKYWYLKAHDAGFNEATTMLGMVACDENNYSEAVKWLREAADKGNSDAQNRLSFLYKEGLGVPKDDVESFKLIKKAAQQEDVEAQCTLGYFYYYGEGTSKNVTRAKQYLLKAHKEGFDAATTLLGIIAMDEEDFKKAFEYFETAAQNGYAEAQNALGNLYDIGLGTSENKFKAFKWYKKAAQQDWAEAQYNLALCYRYGEGTFEDDKRSKKWMKEAAKQGYKDAINDLEEHYGESV